MRLTLVWLFVALSFTAKGQDTARVMFYNLLNFPTGGSPITDREDSLQKILNYVEPDVLLVCELNNPAGPPMILDSSLIGLSANYAMANYVPNQSSSNNLQNLIFYNSDKFTLYSQSEILNDLRDINKYVLYYNDVCLPLHRDTTFLDFYVAHMKAGNSDVLRRDSMVRALRDHLNTQTGPRFSVLGADLNMKKSSELGYQNLMSGTYPWFDPINSPGDWDGPLFAPLHTQCTRLFRLGDGSFSGMDDRLDHIMVSGHIMSGIQRVRYVANSYQAFGNDGLHYDDSLLAPPAHPSIPASVMSSLFYMSDHLPVVMDLEIIPPVICPIEVLYFDAKQEELSMTLHLGLNEIFGNEELLWERSLDGENFTPLHSNVTNAGGDDYQFIDNEPVEGISFYRVQMRDLNGEVSYSPVVTADFRRGRAWQVLPLVDARKIRIYNLGNEGFEGTISILDMKGMEVGQLSAQSNAEAFELSLESLQLSQGLYVIRAHNQIHGSSRTLRFPYF